MTDLDLATYAREALARLLRPGTRVVIGVSGGPDSQALLDVIGRVRAELGVAAVWALGIDHGLRPEAGSELDLAETLAGQHEVPFARRRVQVDRQGNLPANARRARYEALAAFADEVGADRIAVAHTATDQAETILLHLARGCALRGAAAMPYRRGRLVRPFLAVTHARILAYLAMRGIAFALDPSNEDERRARPRVRRHILPVLESLNPAAMANMARFARLARRDERYLEERAQALLRAARGPAGSLSLAQVRCARPPLQPRIVAAWLREEQLELSASGRRQLLSASGELALRAVGGGRIIVSHGYAWGEPAAPARAAYEWPLAVPGRCELPHLALTVTSRIEGLQNDATWRKAAQVGQVAFDADRLHLSLCVRSARSGDRLRPFGLQGTAKLGNVFTNAKMPRFLRQSWPVVVSDDTIAWVVGLRRGSIAPVSSQTRRVLILEVEGALPWSAC